MTWLSESQRPWLLAASDPCGEVGRGCLTCLSLVLMHWEAQSLGLRGGFGAPRPALSLEVGEAGTEPRRRWTQPVVRGTRFQIASASSLSLDADWELVPVSERILFVFSVSVLKWFLLKRTNAARS